MTNLDLKGSRTLITGATGGIGQQIARTLHSKGAELTLSGRRTDVLANIAGEVGARTIAADLSEVGDVRKLVAEAGEIDLLVANAALPGSGPLLDYSFEEVERSLAVNLLAPVTLARAVAEGMAARGKGHIVFTGSILGVITSPGSSLYSAAKYGLRGFALSLRQDLRNSGVGVSVVEPGFVSDAGMFAETGVELPKGTRTVTPKQVADSVVGAVEGDKPEVIVAPVELRVAARVGSVFPSVAELTQRLAGADKISREMGEAQRPKR